jgi:hypothetical protein
MPGDPLVRLRVEEVIDRRVARARLRIDPHRRLIEISDDGYGAT